MNPGDIAIFRRRPREEGAAESPIPEKGKPRAAPVPGTRIPARSAKASGGAMAEGSAGCEAEPRGPAGLGRSARGPGVCRVFAGRRHMARAPVMWAGPRRPKIVLSAGAMGHAPPVRPAGRRLADSHLASPTAMHAVGPPPFPRWPQVMSGGWARASELSAGRAADAGGAPADGGRPPAGRRCPHALISGP